MFCVDKKSDIFLYQQGGIMLISGTFIGHILCSIKTDTIWVYYHIVTWLGSGISPYHRIILFFKV